MVGQRLTIDRQLGARIRFARLERNLSPAALGARLGMPFEQVTRLENGDLHISSEQLTEIAAALDKGVSFFFQNWMSRSPSGGFLSRPGEEQSTVELLATMLSDGTRTMLSGGGLRRASPLERDHDLDPAGQRIGYLQ